jgi:uncharacterized protein (DUF2236 family)
VHSLSAEEQERYYQEMAFVARLFGTPAEVIPRSLADFRCYFADQLAGTTVTVTEPAREIAAVILEAPLPAPLRLLAPRTGSPPPASSPSGSAPSTDSAGAPCTSLRSRLPPAPSG